MKTPVRIQPCPVIVPACTILSFLLLLPAVLHSQEGAGDSLMVEEQAAVRFSPSDTVNELDETAFEPILLHSAEDSVHAQVSGSLEEYRTLLAEGDLAGLREMMRDSALIVVGHVTRKAGASASEPYATWGSYRPARVEVTTERKNRNAYLNRLGEILDAAKQLKVQFDSIRVMSFPLYPDWYGATLYQDWDSDFYDDSGWLFVLFEAGEGMEPLIVVRAWQTVAFKQEQIVGFLDTYADIAATLQPRKREPLPPVAGDERSFPLGASGDSVLMVYVTPGPLSLGASAYEQHAQTDEYPRLAVDIEKPFWLGKYELTQRQWRTVTGVNPSVQKGDSLPVSNVSWYDVQDLFLGFLRMSGDTLWRLPSEREWEYACRAGMSTRFPWGDDPEYSNVDAYGWYGANSDSSLHPVGRKIPNAWGLFDMQGNVYEWCADHWTEIHDTTLVTQEAWKDTAGTSYRVTRGGDWSVPARFLRSANRARQYADRRSPYIGVRLARTVAEKPDTSSMVAQGTQQTR
jgi:formylglycine-generating enzyme required for sulfatase activity